jgi:flagellar biosynthesis/type III secretory pathway chaperone
MIASNNDYTKVKEQLVVILKKEISYLSELSSSVSQEQQVILENDTQRLSGIIQERESLLVELVKIREKRIVEEKRFNSLSDSIEAEGQEVNLYLDQVKELLQRMHNQSFRNSYLLKKKVLFARDLFEKIQPKVNNLTYSSKGLRNKKEKVSTVTIINKEV